MSADLFHSGASESYLPSTSLFKLSSFTGLIGFFHAEVEQKSWHFPGLLAAEDSKISSKAFI